MSNYLEVNRANQHEEVKTLINYKRVWYRVLRYWYLVLLTIFVAVASAFIYNRYATKIYSVSASIIIKESEEAGQTAELLYNNPLINSYRNFLNEPYIIRSYPILQQVIDSLGLTVEFYQEGNLKTSELYKGVPIKISGNKHGNRYLTGSYDFKINSDNEYTLAPRFEIKGDTIGFEAKRTITGEFDKTLEISNFPITIHKIDSIQRFLDQHYIINFVNGYNLAKSYSSRLTVEWAEEGASVVNLKINGPIMKKEEDFLSVLIQIYKLYDLNNKKEAASNSKKFIDQQLSYIADSLLLVEMQLQHFKDNNSQVDLGVEAQRILLKIDGLEQTKSEYSIRESYYKYLIPYLNQEHFNNQIVLPSAVGINDQILNKLISQMADLQLQAKMSSAPTSRENPIRIKLDARINDLRHAILESVNNLRASDLLIVNQTNSELESLEDQLKRLPKVERQLVTIQRAYHLGENLFIFLTQKRTEAAISEASTISDILTVNPAGQDGQVISPNTKRNYIIALIIGLTFPFGIFVVLEILNTKIQSREDIEMSTSIPIIGIIGHNANQEQMVVSSKPKSAIAEAFRSLRSNLNYFVKKEKMILMITSSISGEGKSFTTLNLANILALSGKKTLILGADMRKPRLFQDLNLDNSYGLSNYLSDQADLSSIVQPTDVNNLFVITGGPVPPNPGELLLRSNFAELISNLSENYDAILIDTPPIGIVSDGLEVAPLVDHTLYIVRQNYTSKEAIAGAQNHVSQGKLENISLVFNDIYKFGPGYGYSYGYGYGYGKRKNGNGGYYEE